MFTCQLCKRNTLENEECAGTSSYSGSRRNRIGDLPNGRTMNTWLLLIYKVPNEPSARRVYVWRKLKGMGAILLQDSAWVLPANSRTRERMQWLATEIRDMEGGVATLWEAQEVFTVQSTNLVQQFTAQVENTYKEILAQLEQEDPNLAALSKQYQQVSAQDYFQSTLGQRVKDALLKRRGADES